MVHVEIWLGGGKTVGARYQRGVIQVHNSYKFVSKTYGDMQYYFRSLDTWLDGICKRFGLGGAGEEGNSPSTPAPRQHQPRCPLAFGSTHCYCFFTQAFVPSTSGKRSRATTRASTRYSASRARTRKEATPRVTRVTRVTTSRVTISAQTTMTTTALWWRRRMRRRSERQGARLQAPQAVPLPLPPSSPIL